MHRAWKWRRHTRVPAVVQELVCGESLRAMVSIEWKSIHMRAGLLRPRIYDRFSRHSNCQGCDFCIIAIVNLLHPPPQPPQPAPLSPSPLPSPPPHPPPPSPMPPHPPSRPSQPPSPWPPWPGSVKDPHDSPLDPPSDIFRTPALTDAGLPPTPLEDVGLPAWAARDVVVLSQSTHDSTLTPALSIPVIKDAVAFSGNDPMLASHAFYAQRTALPPPPSIRDRARNPWVTPTVLFIGVAVVGGCACPCTGSLLYCVLRSIDIPTRLTHSYPNALLAY